MTKKDLVKIIREVVRHEVKKEVRQIFIKENQSKENIELPKPKVTEKKNYTKNKSLNDVLNETVGLTKTQSQTEDYPTLGGGTCTLPGVNCAFIDIIVKNKSKNLDDFATFFTQLHHQHLLLIVQIQNH